MRRKAFLVASLTTIALSLPLSGAIAQLPPPIGPSATFYGSVTGAAVGDGVSSFIFSGNRSAWCGDSKVIPPSSSTYSIQIYSDAQLPGCGAPGRTVHFYIAPANPTQPGNMAAETGTILDVSNPRELNLTLGVSLMVKRIGVQVAADGIPGQ